MHEIIHLHREMRPITKRSTVSTGPVLPFNDQAWQEMQNIAIAEERYFGYGAFNNEVDETLRAAWVLNKRFKARVPNEMVHSTTDFYRKVRDGWYVSIQEILESIAGRWAATLHPDLEADAGRFLTEITLDSFKARRKTPDDIAKGNKLLKTVIQLLETQTDIGEIKFSRMYEPVWEQHAVRYVARIRGCPDTWH